MRVAAEVPSVPSFIPQVSSGRTRLGVILSYNCNGTVAPSPRPPGDLAQLELGTPPRNDVGTTLASKQRLEIVAEVLREETGGLSRRGRDEDLGFEGRRRARGRRHGLGREQVGEGSQVDTHITRRLVHLYLGRPRAGVRILLRVSQPLLGVLDRPGPSCAPQLISIRTQTQSVVYSPRSTSSPLCSASFLAIRFLSLACAFAFFSAATSWPLTILFLMSLISLFSP